MNQTSKVKSQQDANQTLQYSFNDVDATLSVNGFLVGKVGHRIDQTIATTNQPNDTEIFSFSDSGTALYTLTIVYTDGSRGTLLYAARTA